MPEILADGKDAAFALNCFDHQSADGGVEFGFEIRDIIETNEFDAGNQRCKRLAIFLRVT